MELKCVVHQAKPKAIIVWFRENAEFYTGKKFFLYNFDIRQFYSMTRNYILGTLKALLSFFDTKIVLE